MNALLSDDALSARYALSASIYDTSSKTRLNLGLSIFKTSLKLMEKPLFDALCYEAEKEGSDRH